MGKHTYIYIEAHSNKKISSVWQITCTFIGVLKNDM